MEDEVQYTFIMKKVFFTIILIVGIGVLLGTAWYTNALKKNSLVSPHFSSISSSDSIHKSRIVYGFLPYWLGDKSQFHSELTHWAFFSLSIDADGSIITRADPGYNFFQKSFSQLSEQAQEKQIQTELTFTQFDEEKLLAFLNSTSAQRQFFTQLRSILQQHSVQGINIDFETAGDTSIEEQKQFTEFIQRLNSWLNDYDPKITLTIDVYPSSIERTTLWNISDIHSELDYIVVMTYDFHRASSNNAGPISPLLSTGEQHKEKNIVYYLAQFLKVVPSEKILLGVPFYGYEWQTTEPFPRSFTFPRTGSTASLDRIQTLINDPSITIQYFWEDTTLSPFLHFQKNDKHYLISYENALSLKYKLDLVNESDLGGIAIWALGYEGQSRELWEVIRQQTKVPASE